jgi:hypothetical protein
MDNMSASRPPRASRPGRHLVAVPDAQQAMWETDDLLRLAYLRRMAVASGATAALRIIDAAATADDAIEELAEAGLMPSDEQSAEEILAWFSPLLEPGRDQLDAEICAAGFIGTIRRAVASEGDVPPVVCGAIRQAAGHDRPETVAMLHSLAVIGPDESRVLAAEELAGRADSLILPWASGLGEPAPAAAFGYHDVYGEQQSLVLAFGYGRKRHALVLLIDHVLGGGLKDCFVTEYKAAIRDEYRKAGEDPDLVYRELSVAAAATLAGNALECPACPQEPEQIENLENYLDLARSRAALLFRQSARSAAVPAEASNVIPVAGRRRSGPARNVHRVKVTLRDVRPAVWRRLEVPSDISLDRLHQVIQAGFGWASRHLFVFETPHGPFGSPDPESNRRSAVRTKLSAVADWPGDKFRYDYDLGNGWQLDVVLEAVVPAEPGIAYPRCTAGRRAAPPEDCGGVAGYDELTRGRRPAPAGFDPDEFDLAAATAGLAKLARVLHRLT